MKISSLHDATIVNLGDMEIWDGADLSLIRDTLFELITKKHQTRVGIDMSWVKYVPSGFFGMLTDWHDKGIRVTLLSPQQNVREMLWFRQFFSETEADCFVLQSEPVGDFPIGDPSEDDDVEPSVTRDADEHPNKAARDADAPQPPLSAEQVEQAIASWFGLALQDC